MKQATHFIEVIKTFDNDSRCMSPNKIKNLKVILKASVSLSIETIAIFKIYPKNKPAIAHYDNDLKAIVIE